MEDLKTRVDILEVKVKSLEDYKKDTKDDIKEMKKEQSDMKSDISVIKEVLLRLEKGWEKFDDSQKDNNNKIKVGVFIAVVSAIISILSKLKWS